MKQIKKVPRIVWALAGLFSGLVLFILLIIILKPLISKPSEPSRVVLTVIAPQVEAGLPSPTPETDSASDSSEPETMDFEIGQQVRITGTQGEGLRIRELPDLGAVILDLGEEEEIFIILGGPTISDEYLWWFIEAENDPEKRGWAVENYLEHINR